MLLISVENSKRKMIKTLILITLLITEYQANLFAGKSEESKLRKHILKDYESDLRFLNFKSK
jgi:hypothetical protein